MMTCEEFANKVSDYLDGRVPYGDRIGMWVHALMCEPCRRYLDQMRQVTDALGEVGEQERADDESAPCEHKEDLMEEFRSKFDE